MYLMTFPAVIVSSITIGPFTWSNDQRGDLCKVLQNPLVANSRGSDLLGSVFCWAVGETENVQDMAMRMCTPSGWQLFPTLCQGYSHAQFGGFFLVAATMLNMLGIITTIVLLYNYFYGRSVIKASYRERAQVMFASSFLTFVAGGLAYYVVTLQYLFIDTPVLSQMGLPVATSWILRAQGQGNLGFGAYMFCGSLLVQVIMGLLIMFVRTSKEMSAGDAQAMKWEAETDAMLGSRLTGEQHMASYGIA